MADGIWHRQGKRYHEYGCPQYGRPRWDRLLRWSRHWVEVGGDGPEQRVHCTIVQWLFLGIRFGPMVKQYRSPKMYVPSHGWYPREIGERIVKHLAKERAMTNGPR